MSAASDYLEVELRKAIFRTSTYTQRANSTAYSVGDRVYAASFDGNFYECIQAGTSGGSPPTFNTALGDTTTDGTVTWLTVKPGLPKRPLYVALFTAVGAPEAGTVTEVAGGSYARVAVPPLDANWSAPDATGGLTDNVSAVTFPTPSASWGVITHFGFFDRLTGGNLLIHGALAASKTVNNGDPAPVFNAGALDVTIA